MERAAFGVCIAFVAGCSGRARIFAIAAKLRAPSGPNGWSVPTVIAHLRQAAKRCYQRSLHDDPALSAHVRVTMRVDGPGRVVSAVSGDALPAPLQQCLTDAAQRIQTMDARGEMVVPFLFRAP